MRAKRGMPSYDLAILCISVRDSTALIGNKKALFSLEKGLKCATRKQSHGFNGFIYVVRGAGLVNHYESTA